MYFDDAAEFQKHIEDDHVTMTALDSQTFRSRKYNVVNVNATSTSDVNNTKWVVDNILVSNVLFSFRDQIISRHVKGESLSDTDLLGLDYIFPFSKNINDSVPGFTNSQHKSIIANIEIMQYTRTINKFAIKWCTKLSEMELLCWRSVKLATVECLSEAAATENADDFLAAEIIHALSARLLNGSSRKQMLEDSFAHKYLDAILETIFGSDENFKQDWANGTLLPGSKRKRANELKEENNDEDNDIKVDNDNDTKKDDLVYKPDWALFAKSGSMLTVIGTLELKVAYKRNMGYVSDYVKLAKEMKLVLHRLIYLGVTRPVAYGILVQGSKFETFAMDLAYDGVYRFVKLSQSDLCISLEQLPLFPNLFGNLMHLRTLALEVAMAVNTCLIDRQLGRPVEQKTPLSWLRVNSANILVKANHLSKQEHSNY
ncbi:hypothetical protein PHYBLDRAFT_68062 [Phycomyces blakesleeanus NRRL 1555(-)]|uniref:Uncharacterized protein n=1 Tax=Phycomyces blakesleeanus (strain ATCC 8743b / DSM 1359 / FGSC 10004 / NBRC 33097 / NRRL 1555) TaxID=763407 RepID=A0A167P2J2_PHYB8|nr:hypothetical protein PHYBLDRAFT_68062 [Phycomyces blakesleeanus NRRL 1555(-)]OAD77126.1 hypothetical protein PHYBLDRAFT_68062 [Phycomyces blakesleeanus NRRL 1555(-)]|eukprot:XP_018295166.1 hypothetical protein PHYBLDRAFT_68062 [Phycomyces blakesleeanus NRRL 1555(-)]